MEPADERSCFFAVRAESGRPMMYSNAVSCTPRHAQVRFENRNVVDCGEGSSYAQICRVSIR